MQEINSVENQQVKKIVLLQKKAKERRETGTFVIEGERLVTDVPVESLEEIYMTRDFWEKYCLAKHSPEKHFLGRDSFDRHSPENHLSEKSSLRTLSSEDQDHWAVKTTLVSQAVMQKISDTKSPQGILAVAKMPEWNEDDLLDRKEKMPESYDTSTGVFSTDYCDHYKDCSATDHRKNPPLLLFLEDIQDPGNLGTIFRTAEAAGVTGIVMGRGCVDVFNPKVVRSTMSSIFREPFLIADNLCDMINKFRQKGISVYAAYLDPSAEPYDQPDYTAAGGVGFLVGNEGNGLSDEAVETADQTIYIPMQGKIESLNAAMSAGILMYEAARQRRNFRNLK